MLSEEVLCAEPYLQGHLFADVSEEHRASRLRQLNEIDGSLPGGLKGYLQRARSLLQEAQAGSNPFAGLKVEIPDGLNLSGASGPGSEGFAEMEVLGMKQLASCAFCLVAGGLGERLGFPGIKIGITAEVVTGMTFIELYCSFILACQRYAQSQSGDPTQPLPFAVMTSGDTHEPTVEMFQRHDYFGLRSDQVHFLRQEKVPALLDVEARIAAKDGLIETKPHGHGDVHSLLHQHGLSKRWAEEGRQWLFVFQDTNPLTFRILCAFLGVSVKNDYVMNSVAIPRLPGESIGGICKLVDSAGSGLTLNVEYNQLDPLLKETPAGGDKADDSGFSPYPGNINVLLFRIPQYAQCLEQTGGVVPEFINPKWADAEKTKFKSSTRLECLMQDFPRLCRPEDKVGMTQLDRWIAKTSVKNNLADARKKQPPECAFSAETDIYACNTRLLQLAGDVEVETPSETTFLGITANLGAQIVLQPSFAISLEQLKSKIRGKIVISKRSTLILEGDVILDGLKLDGALWLSGSGRATGLCVENQGLRLAAIAEAELAKQVPSLQIRGYQKEVLEMETIKL
ncbi:unnamed protein product [Effrenium voratum]|nr:unnamed protein product [Effrenium voratum]